MKIYQVQVHGIYSLDTNTQIRTISGYDVISWDGLDGDMLTLNFPDASTFGSVLSGSLLGLSQDADRLFLFFNEDGSLNGAQGQVTSFANGSSLEQGEFKSIEQLSDIYNTDALNLRASQIVQESSLPNVKLDATVSDQATQIGGGGITPPITPPIT